MKKIQKKQPTKRRYTMSTLTFNSLKEAKDKILHFADIGDFNEDTKIFEIANEYEIEIKKVVSTKKVKDEDKNNNN